MSTTTTFLGLVKPELTDVADITACNSNWDKIDERLHKSKASITMSASAWSSSKTYTLTTSAIKSTEQTIELLPSPNITAEQLEALQVASIVGTKQEVGSITITALGEVPTIDIPVVFIFRGDV